MPTAASLWGQSYVPAQGRPFKLDADMTVGTTGTGRARLIVAQPMTASPALSTPVSLQPLAAGALPGSEALLVGSIDDGDGVGLAALWGRGVGEPRVSGSRHLEAVLLQLNVLVGGIAAVRDGERDCLRQVGPEPVPHRPTARGALLKLEEENCESFPEYTHV